MNLFLYLGLDGVARRDKARAHMRSSQPVWSGAWLSMGSSHLHACDLGMSRKGSSLTGLPGFGTSTCQLGWLMQCLLCWGCSCLHLALYLRMAGLYRLAHMSSACIRVQSCKTAADRLMPCMAAIYMQLVARLTRSGPMQAAAA